MVTKIILLLPLQIQAYILVTQATDNITPSSSGTGGVSISDLKTSSKCVSGAALGDGRLTLADVIIMFHLLILGMVDLRG